MSNSNFYAKEASLKLFFMIAIPGTISMIASSLWSLFDGIFVGNLLGKTAFATLNLAFPFVLINFSLADLIGVAYMRVYAFASPFTTMIFAVDNFLRICGKIKTSMTLNIVMSVLILGLEYLCRAVLKMGIEGSATAVSIGMFLCTIIALLGILWPLQLTGIWLNAPITAIFVSLIAWFFLKRLKR